MQTGLKLSHFALLVCFRLGITWANPIPDVRQESSPSDSTLSTTLTPLPPTAQIIPQTFGSYSGWKIAIDDSYSHHNLKPTKRDITSADDNNQNLKALPPNTGTFLARRAIAATGHHIQSINELLPKLQQANAAMEASRPYREINFNNKLIGLTNEMLEGAPEGHRIHTDQAMRTRFTLVLSGGAQENLKLRSDWTESPEGVEQKKLVEAIQGHLNGIGRSIRGKKIRAAARAAVDGAVLPPKTEHETKLEGLIAEVNRAGEAGKF